LAGHRPLTGLPPARDFKQQGALMRRVILATWLLSFSLPAAAQDWPTRPITMVVPVAPGGVYDTLGRLYASRLSEILGQPAIVENVAGGAMVIGSARVANAAADGYQILFGGLSTHATIQALNTRLRYNPATDFTPVALVAEQPLMLVARKSIPAVNLADFLAYARANSGRMQYGSPGPGTGSHLACAMLNAAAGITVTHVPYRGLGPATTDLLGGRIDYMCPTATTAIPLIDGGQIRAIAVLTRERSPLLPNVATAHEQGVKDIDANTWSAIFLPKNALPALVSKLNVATIAAMDTPTLQARLNQLGATVPPPERRSSEFLKTFVAREIDKWAAAIKMAGVTATD
jgi:tripartite-type tricarboxylate transporter receptor subunit TctC